ncbi:ARM repeat-containing protein [Clavulina sp. PMI_390]|nr:ARM repeat-containing protein [Clavulina sp. PMI_390]
MDIYQALESASSQDPSRVHAGMKSLESIHGRPGAFREVLSIAANRGAPLDIRRMAIIQFKNVATNQWRNRKLLSPEDRTIIRQGLTTFFDEVDDTIAQCSAVIIAKIFRIDSTKEWPQLLPGLAEVIQTNSSGRFSPNPSPTMSLILRRALYTLNQVIKEVSGAKLPAGIQLTQQIVKETHTFLTDKYQMFSAHILSSLNPTTIATPQLTSDIQNAHLFYKCLSKNMIWLWTRSRATEEDAMQTSTFFSSSVPLYKSWYDLRISLLRALKSSGQPPSPAALATIEQLTKHVLAFGKFFRRLQQPAIPKFVALPASSDLVLYCWGKVVEANSGPPEDIGETSDSIFHVRALLQGMVLFKDCLGQWTPTKQANVDRGNPLLNEEFVTQAVTLIVTRFLPLKPMDLEKWEADPEEWVLGETKDYDSWEFDIRICAERVLMTFLDRYPHFTAPLLTNALATELSTPPSIELQNVLRREAIFFSIGGHFNRLRTVIDLNQLISVFAQEVQNPSPTYRILKRRIAWVIGKSAPEEELAPGVEPSAKIWELLAYLVNDQSESSDLAVRLTAALAIRERADSLTFDQAALNPHLASIIGALMQLVAEVDAIESKTHIARTLNTMIERNAERMIPFMRIITDPIPQLWGSSGNDWLFKAALLDTMTQLVQAAKDQSLALHYIVVPMVQESLKPEFIIQLDQDGLNLWLAALRNATSIHTTTPGVPGLLDLVPGAINLLANNLDLLSTIVSITESYYLVDVASVLQAYGAELFQAVVACLDQALSTNAKELLVSLETLILSAPSNLWAKPMYDSGFFKKVLDTVKAGKGSAEINNAYTHVLARMIFSDANTFFQMLAAVPNEDPSQSLDKLLDQWWRQFDNMSEPRHRKLTAMAFGALVATGRPEVLKRLSGETFNLWLDVLGEMKEALSTSDTENHLTLYWRENGSQIPDFLLKDSEGSLEEGRRRQLYANDPINSTLLTAYLRQKLEEGRQNAPGGPPAFDAAMQQADQLVVKQLLQAIA